MISLGSRWLGEFPSSSMAFAPAQGHQHEWCFHTGGICKPQGIYLLVFLQALVPGVLCHEIRGFIRKFLAEQKSP